MNADVSDRLTAIRPAPSIDAHLGATMLTAVLETTTPKVRRDPWSPRRRRTVVGVSLAGLAAVAAVVVPAVVPSSTPVIGHASPAAAAELRRLATVVEHHGPVTLGQDQYLYIAEQEVQKGWIGFEYSGRTVNGIALTRRAYGTRITHRQGWTSRTGRLWRRDAESSPIERHSVDDYVIAPNADDSPKRFAAMPTEPDRLDRYLLRDGYGSGSDEAVFEQIEFILQTGIAPPTLRSAALEVLADTDHVTVSKDVRDSLGRTAERFTLTYRSQGRSGTEAVYLDPRNARVLETTMVGFGSTFVDTVRRERVVNSVPAAVRTHAHK